MADAGKLYLGVTWDGNVVRGTEVRSTRPMAARMFTGKTPAQVLHIVPLLFSACGRAQAAAAGAALRLAQAELPAVATMERMIVCEAIQEHLWRLMLDWPKLLGLAQREQQFARWYAMLRQIAAGENDMAGLLREFENECLGVAGAEWRRLASYRALQAWWRETDSPLAQLLLRLDELGHGGDVSENVRILPAWSAAAACRACGGKWDTAFSASPDWMGSAAETGALSYFPDDPLLRDLRQSGRPKALVRLAARILDVIEMASGNGAARMDAASPAPGEGVALVRTARGTLMHYVRIADKLVADYVIVAPTEWNFHPAGAFAQDLRDLDEEDVERLKQLAHIEALSLDPCVPFQIEVHHA